MSGSVTDSRRSLLAQNQRVQHKLPPKQPSVRTLNCLLHSAGRKAMKRQGLANEGKHQCAKSI